MALSLTPDVVKEFTPHGRLRAALNLGNGILVQKDAATGRLSGITLARELAAALGTSLEFVEYDQAGHVADAVKKGAWDICFLAIDPVRAAEIDFTAAYVVIEGTYLVSEKSPLRDIADVDREGIRIVVTEKSAYDLYLTRAIKKAELIRAKSTPESFELFAAKGYEVMAGVRQPLVGLSKAHAGFRVMTGRFTEIKQAMGTPKGRPQAARHLKAFVEEMKASGFVARALAESGQTEAEVAPSEPVG